jgi:hypothetical protein
MSCRLSERNRGKFSGDLFHFRKFHKQFFHLPLFMRVGQAGLLHGAILSRTRVDEKRFRLQ